MAQTLFCNLTEVSGRSGCVPFIMRAHTQTMLAHDCSYTPVNKALPLCIQSLTLIMHKYGKEELRGLEEMAALPEVLNSVSRTCQVASSHLSLQL